MNKKALIIYLLFLTTLCIAQFACAQLKTKEINTSIEICEERGITLTEPTTKFRDVLKKIVASIIQNEQHKALLFHGPAGTSSVFQLKSCRFLCSFYFVN